MLSKQANYPDNKTLRILFITLGTISLILGIIGIVLPLLPTTPFLLLAALCYARGSQKAYYWLLHNRLFGEYISNYQDGKGIPINAKIYTLSFLWVTILISILLINLVWITVILILIALLVTIHILKIKTYKKTSNPL